MMNKIIDIRLIVLFIGFATFLFSCSKETTVDTKALELDRNAIEIHEGYTATIEIVSGNGNYAVSETDLVTVDISGDAITFTATGNYGEERVFVSDGAGQKVALDINVIPAVLGSDDPRFYWDNLIALEQTNGWATTIMDNKVAITNIEEKRQYVLAWSGEFAAGIKPRATLRILDEEGKQEVTLTKLEILTIDRGKNLCTIVFFREAQRGELVFVLP